MKPVIFVGEVPEHLMSEAVLAEQNLRAHEEYLEQHHVGRFVDVLRGDLDAAAPAQILEAAGRILAEPWNDQFEPPPKNVLKVPDAEVTSLVTKGLKHLQAASADPSSPQHWRQWTSREFATIDAMAAKVAKFGCSEDLALLAWRALAEGCNQYSYNLCDGLQAHVAALHAVDPAKADDFEIKVVRSAPGYHPRRYGPWVKPQSHRDGLPNSKAFAERALAVMTEDQADRFISSCDYDWLTPAQVRKAMVMQPSAERAQRFSTAAKDQVRELFEHLVSRAGVRDFDVAVMCLRDVPAWKEFAADLEAIRPTFQASPFTLDGKEQRMHLSRVNTLLGVVHKMPAGKAIVLLDDMVAAGVRELAAAPADKARSMASGLVDLVSYLANRTRPNVPFIRASLLEQDFLRNPNVCPNGLAVLDGERGSNADDAIRRQLKRSEMPAEVITAYRAMFIEAGLVSIGSIRPIDQRKDIIGPALVRNPERLAEVIDLERFLDVARRFSIPVELPDTVRPELRLQASMQTAMSKAADPLAAGDPLARATSTPRRRMRA